MAIKNFNPPKTTWFSNFAFSTKKGGLDHEMVWGEEGCKLGLVFRVLVQISGIALGNL
jgi:hypothetical protein